jgi:hypothetical protein
MNRINDTSVPNKMPRSGVDISNGSKVIAFSIVGLQKFKMAAGGLDGGIFPYRFL